MATTTTSLRPLSPAGPPIRKVPVGVRQRRRAACWWAACLACGGLLGLALAVRGTLRGERPTRRRVLLVVGGAVVQLVCASLFAGIAVAGDLRACPAPAPVWPAEAAAPTYGPPSSAPKAPPQHGGAWQTLRTAINAPVSGAALLYGEARGGAAYQCAGNGTTAVVMDNGFSRGGTMYGTVFLTDQRTEAASPRMRRLSEHEAKHADQWAVSTLLAGPLAFPALYSADESLFPGAFNHFERAAGLADGGYVTPPDSPPAPGRLAFLIVGLLAGYFVASRRRDGGLPDTVVRR
ncbi:hypothetical protein [Streptomyces boninensis]|uniref:hypothetical protein n=1 Tax=Streptomyces boninensis TaxID=2039455 RepID=UPI003B216F4B